MSRLTGAAQKNRWFNPAAVLLSVCFLFLSMPGYFGWWPLLFVALVPLFAVCLHLPPLRSAGVGFLAGLSYNVLTIHWIVVVLGRYGGLPIWLSVSAMVLLAMYMGLFLAIFCLLLSLLAGRYWQKERSISTLVWTAPVLWVGLDYLRSVLFTGFPWLDLGYGLYSQPLLIQSADLGGHHLLTFAVVLANGLVLSIIDRQGSNVRWNIGMERRVLFAACSFLVFVFGYSMLRYRVMPSFLQQSLHAEVSVIQGNIGQDEKWNPGRKEKTVAKYERLSRQALSESTTELLIWPETALPFYPQSDPLAGRVADLVQSENIYLLTGAPTFGVVETNGEKHKEFFNSALLIDPNGVVTGSYSKQHLVPFGEYIPFRKYLPYLAPVVETIGDFSAGRSSAPLSIGDHLRLGILICFESIFPRVARDEVAHGANLLVNLTNDAWYGRTSAPYQSMAMSVLRAVETKRSLIRAANTGISCIVYPSGEIIDRTDIFHPAVLTGQVPVLEKETVFVRSGYHFGVACLALIPALLLFRNRHV